MPRRAARADPPHTRGPSWRNSAGRRPVSCDSCPSPAQPKSDGTNSEAPRKNRTTKFSSICAYAHKVRGWGETSTRGMARRPAEPRIANAVGRMRPNREGTAAGENGLGRELTVRGRRRRPPRSKNFYVVAAWSICRILANSRSKGGRKKTTTVLAP